MVASIGSAVSIIGLPSWKEAKRLLERAYCEKLLHHVRGNMRQAARLAETDVTSFRQIMKRCGVRPEGFRS